MSFSMTTMKKELYDEMVVNITKFMREDGFNQQQILLFIKDNDNNIKNAVNEMYSDYEYGMLDELKNRECDWVREYLFNHIKLPDECILE